MICYSPKIVTDGLVLYLDAANIKSYPGTGTSWYDLSGNGNNGTMYGAIYNSANKGSIVFNGTSDYVALGISTSLNALVDEETVIAWCKTSNIDAARRGSIGNRHSGFLTIYGSSLGYESSDENGAWGNNCYTGVNAVKLDTWQQFAFTFKKDYRVEIYINSINVAGKDVSGKQSTSTGGYYIGTEAFGGWGTPPYFMGNISIVQNYNRALSITEIAQNFNAIKNRYEL